MVIQKKVILNIILYIGDECYSICLSPNNKYAVTGGSNCSVKLWDL